MLVTMGAMVSIVWGFENVPSGAPKAKENCLTSLLALFQITPALTVRDETGVRKLAMKEAVSSKLMPVNTEGLPSTLKVLVSP